MNEPFTLHIQISLSGTYEWAFHPSHTNKPFRHIRMSLSGLFMRLIPHMYEWVCHTYECRCRVKLRHRWKGLSSCHMSNTHMNESCHTYEWVVSYIWMSAGVKSTRHVCCCSVMLQCVVAVCCCSLVLQCVTHMNECKCKVNLAHVCVSVCGSVCGSVCACVLQWAHTYEWVQVQSQLGTCVCECVWVCVGVCVRVCCSELTYMSECRCKVN